VIALTRKEKFIFLKVYFLALGLIAVFGWGFGNFGSIFWEMIFNFLFGWLVFLFRVLGSSIGAWFLLAALGLLVLIGPIHLGLSWLYARNKKPNQPEGIPPPRWQSRWTIAWFGLALLVVLSGVAMLGFLLNSYWLATSPEPMK
jgi:hypothetical protein